jgi:N-acetylmuramoyl-L-alanine amidase
MIVSGLIVLGGGARPIFFAYNKAVDYLAATFFVPSITTDELKSAYFGYHPTHEKLKIILVPGHEPSRNGGEYGGVKERDVVVDIAKKLQKLLEENGKYEVIITRDKLNWQEPFASYFLSNKKAIVVWREKHLKLMEDLVLNGKILTNQVYTHATASSEDAMHLYGVQKWANENDVDVLLHLHINDYSRKGKEKKYTGLSIYTPEEQYSNSSASNDLARAIFSELNLVIATSTLKEEMVGIVPDQELIAIGRFNVADTANVLIEYGYIYEPQYQNNKKRMQVIDEYALRTYQGLENFFNATSSKK